MESELEKFRRRKHLEEKKEEIKTKIQTTANSWMTSFYQMLLPNWNEDEDCEDDEVDEAVNEDTHGDGQQDNSKEEGQGENQGVDNKKWIMYLVMLFRFLAWLLVYVGFLKIGFGAVFFTLSGLAFIYWNTRQGKGRRKRRKGEVSAYSVFNKDCQSIDGTLKAEHLEKQLLYRS